jgi:hypothetical protein
LELSATGARPHGSGGETERDEDSISPEAFAVLCDRYGIVPYRKANMAGGLETARPADPAAGGAVGAAAAVAALGSSAAAPGGAGGGGDHGSGGGVGEGGAAGGGAGGEDDFVPVRRLALRSRFRRVVGMAAGIEEGGAAAAPASAGSGAGASGGLTARG